MANSSSIPAVGKTILGLLEDHCPDSLLESPKFELQQPAHYGDGMSEGFSLLLYRVSVNATLRNLPSRRGVDGRRLRPSLPLDLHYVLTPWAKSADTQQVLLGWAMRFLEDRSILPAGIINSYLPGVFRQDEAIELVCDSLPLQEYFNLWDKLKTKMQVSATYVARMVLLDSECEVAESPAVQTREFQVGEPLQA
ncbi:MAG TPA: DUF4255 domain-containing protein [bacterium]